MNRRRVWLWAVVMTACVPTITRVPSDAGDATVDAAGDVGVDTGADTGASGDASVDVVAATAIATTAVVDVVDASTVDVIDASTVDVIDASTVDVADVVMADVVDAGVPDAGPRQRSCPDAMERGCGLAAVEGGTFTLGSDDAGYPASPEVPGVSVSSFVMDSHEVTVARFRRFWTAGHPAPTSPVVYPGGMVPFEGMVAEPDATSTQVGCNWSTSPGAREAHPINCVGWATAMAFCVWDGGRLPTEAEWEFAARGRRLSGVPYPRAYPWGDERPLAEPRGSCDRAQVGECNGEDGAATRRVGAFAATVGLYDLIGNVQEWVADFWNDYGDPRCWPPATTEYSNPVCILFGARVSVVRRSTFAGSSFALNATYRDAVGANVDMSSSTGFRCVR